MSFQISITEFLRICHKFKKKLFLRKWYRIVGPLMIGLSLCILFYETAKSCVGSLRPHFFAVCRPSIDLKNCTNRYTYITDYNCTAPENDLLIDSRYATLCLDILFFFLLRKGYDCTSFSCHLHCNSCTFVTVWHNYFHYSQGSLEIVGAQLGAGSWRSLRYLSLLERTARVVVMFQIWIRKCDTRDKWHEHVHFKRKYAWTFI